MAAAAAAGGGGGGSAAARPAIGKITDAACISSERDALLAFKAGFADPAGGALRFWQGQDCCAWSGVSCSKKIGSVVSLDIGHYDLTFRGEINSSLAVLTHLVYLNLSGNDFGGVAIPDFIGSFEKLRYLDLSHAGFGGTVPPRLGNLSMLSHLDLSSPSHTVTVKSFDWVSPLTSLVYLDLSWLYLAASSDWLQATNTLPLLKVLCLNHAFLPATDLNALSHTNFTAIRVLDLKSNNFSSRMPDWISKLSSLAYLDLSSCELSGSLPRNLGNLTSLSFFQLRANNLEGEIPGSMSRLCNLSHIDLSGNHFSGDITRLANTLFPCMNQLKILDLALNNLTGSLSGWVRHIASVTTLDLSENSLSGRVSDDIGKLSNLTYLDLSANSFQGNMINRELPKSLKHMKALELLDMSSNQLEGCIPDLPSSVKVLDLSSNHLYGPLPQSLGAKEMYYLSLKDNFLSGSIPTYLCEMVWMEQVLLSLNNFTGVLPNCWRKDSALRIIDFSNNNIHGEISSTMGHLTSLGSLLLHRNKLSGPLPTSLKLCNRLIFLDLSENNLSGTIPTWIGDSLQSLILLSLRSNNFSGKIPELLSQLHALQILDIADNNLSGPVPKSLGNLAAMQLGRHMIQQQFSTISDIHFMVYGASGAVLYRLYAYLYLNSLLAGKLQYNGAAFYIDLSGNQLAGEIPIEIGFLSGLTGLNLSGNHIRGSIPEELGNLRSLEVLDLSRNDLSGPIPQCFLSLSGLSRLNLSYNDLSGAIPFGNGLETFAESTYFGNAGLCGPPLSRSCLYHKRKHKLNFDLETYLSALLGFAFGFCIVFVIMIPNMVA
uniref:non-specific serine/threonine protein kinase n=1 Tax=Oryza nivara TaxID=4536 RepID=A0A0E0HKR6_ORYNI